MDAAIAIIDHDAIALRLDTEGEVGVVVVLLLLLVN